MYVNIEHIKKTYGKIVALEDISLSVAEGELFGLVGPDGAGKTSLFRILTTLLLADEGTATIGEWDVVKDYKVLRTHIGYMPGRFSLYQDLSVEENLEFFASIFNTTPEANRHLIEDIYVQLEPFKDRRAGKLSGGMKQKLALCCALIHKPRILILDEPTTGVDPVSRKEFWEMLKRLKNDGITILVSTPYMDEANLCDRIALIQSGKLLSVNTPAGITNAFDKPLWAVRSDQMFQLLHDLREFPPAVSCYGFGEVHHLTLQNNQVSEADIRQYLQAKSHKHIEITPISANIEDCFMALMNTHN